VLLLLEWSCIEMAFVHAATLRVNAAMTVIGPAAHLVGGVCCCRVSRFEYCKLNIAHAVKMAVSHYECGAQGSKQLVSSNLMIQTLSSLMYLLNEEVVAALRP
jgi:hypothetical protein